MGFGTQTLRIVRPRSNRTCAGCKNIRESQVDLNSSQVLSGGGRIRYTFAALGNSQRLEPDPVDPKQAANYVDGYRTVHWATYNQFAPFYVSFGPEHVHGAATPLAKLDVMIH